jgi:hypothetical protein
MGKLSQFNSNGTKFKNFSLKHKGNPLFQIRYSTIIMILANYHESFSKTFKTVEGV